MRFLAIGIAVLLSISGCSDNGKEKKAEPPPVPITATPAMLRDIPETLRVVGRSEAFESVTVKSRVDGQVAEVLFTEGQHVSRATC